MHASASRLVRTGPRLAFLAFACLSASLHAGEWKNFLLIGQSNMAGVPKPEAADLKTNPRVQMLAYSTCSGTSRVYETWSTAAPPIHECFNGVGPADGFGKMMADSLPGDTIGLIPCAISGVDIDMFRKDITSKRRSEFTIPPDNHWAGAYPWVVERAKLAQKKGKIVGILFHQGESDAGSSTWLAKVAEIVKNLEQDLGTGEIPFLAGELRYDGCCAGHNTIVAKIPQTVPKGKVISASGLTGLTTDRYHFDLAGQRTFGKRYATAMLASLRAGTTGISATEGAIPLRITSDGIEAQFPAGTRDIELIDLAGKVQSLGDGPRVRIAAGRTAPGLHILRARTPEGIRSRTVVVMGGGH